MNSYHLPSSYTMGPQNYSQPHYNNHTPVGSIPSRQGAVPPPPSYSYCSSIGAPVPSNQAAQHAYGQQYMNQTPGPHNIQNNMLNYRHQINTDSSHSYCYGAVNQPNYQKSMQQQTPVDSRYYQQYRSNVLYKHEYPANAFMQQNPSHLDSSYFPPQYGPSQGCGPHQMRSLGQYPPIDNNNSVSHNQYDQQQLQYDPAGQPAWTQPSYASSYDSTGFNRHSHQPEPSSWTSKPMQTDHHMRQPVRYSEQDFQSRVNSSHQFTSSHNVAPYDPPSYHHKHDPLYTTGSNITTIDNYGDSSTKFKNSSYSNTELTQILNDPDDMNCLLSAPYVPPVEHQVANILTGQQAKNEGFKSLPYEAKEKLRQLHSQSHTIPKSQLVPKVKQILVQYIGDKNFSRSLALYSERNQRSVGHHQSNSIPNQQKCAPNWGITELGINHHDEIITPPPPPPPSYPISSSKIGVFSSVVQSPEEGPGSSPIDELVQSTTNADEDTQRLFENPLSPTKHHDRLSSSEVLEALLTDSDPHPETSDLAKEIFHTFSSPSSLSDSAHHKEEIKLSPQNKNSLLIDLLYDNGDLKKNLKRKHDSSSITNGPPDHSSPLPPCQPASNSDEFKRCSSLDSLNIPHSNPSPDHSLRPNDAKRPRNQSHQQISSPSDVSLTASSRMGTYPSYRYSSSSTPSPVGHILAQLLSDTTDDLPTVTKSSASILTNVHHSRKKSSSSDRTVIPSRLNNVKLNSEAFKCPNVHISSSTKQLNSLSNLVEETPADKPEERSQTASSQPKESLSTPELFSSIEFFSDCSDFDLNDIDFDDFLNSSAGRDVFEELENSKIVISSADSRGDLFTDLKELISSEEIVNQDNSTIVGKPARFLTKQNYQTNDYNHVSSSMKID